jgi:hypothetical protein
MIKIQTNNHYKMTKNKPQIIFFHLLIARDKSVKDYFFGCRGAKLLLIKLLCEVKNGINKIQITFKSKYVFVVQVF